jgi:hypothetical protein
MPKVEHHQESGQRMTHPLFSWVELAHMDYAMLTGIPGHCAPEHAGSPEGASSARRCCDDVPTPDPGAPSTIGAVGRVMAFARGSVSAIRRTLRREQSGPSRERPSATEPLPEISGSVLAPTRRI